MDPASFYSSQVVLLYRSKLVLVSLVIIKLIRSLETFSLDAWNDCGSPDSPQTLFILMQFAEIAGAVDMSP